MRILIDNGHGVETPGKRSPDGRFLEYQYNRLIARAIVEHLRCRGYVASLVVPEEKDISLEERCRRINRVAIRHGHEPHDTFVVSIHVPDDFNKRSPDNMILTVALKYKDENPILLTSDNGLQVKAKGLGISTVSLKDFLKR